MAASVTRRIRLPADSRTPAAARAVVRAVLDEADLPVLLDEALLLTSRVVVFSARPGRIVAAFDTNFPRHVPRREVVTSPEFAELKEQALEALEI